MDRSPPEASHFLRQLELQFDSLEPDSLSMDLEFRNLGEWSSMQSLIVIASFDEEYGVTIDAEELRNARTINDLYQLVYRKMQ